MKKSKIKLGDAINFISRGVAPKYVDFGEIQVLNQKAIRWGYIDENNLKYHDHNKNIREDIFIKKGDIVVNSTGDITIGRAFYFKNDRPNLFVDSHVTILRLNKDVLLPEYFIHLIPTKEYQSKIYNLVSGATGQLELSKNKICEIEVDVPSIEKQEKISAILNSYNDLIENNLRQIELLEKSAELLYKEWFVNLRFPEYEKAEIKNGVPTGWNIGKISDFFETSSGGTPSRRKPEYFDGTIPWIKTQELQNTLIIETQEKISEDALRNSSAKLFETGTVLIAMYGATIGQLGILSFPSTTNQACCAIYPKDIQNKTFYLFLYLLHKKEKIISLSQGAAQNNINQQIVRNFPIVIPNQNLLSKFDTISEPIFKQILNLRKTNKKLSYARDLLLPKLINGEIEV